MDRTGIAADLRHYLQHAREALLWKMENLSEYDMRRPLVPTGTNLLGLVKHCAAVEIGYLGDTFARPYHGWVPRLAADDDPNTDMWAGADEASGQIIEMYRRVWDHSNETIETVPLERVGRVPWWPEERCEATLGHLVTRVIADTNRHAGQADIVRELIDGTVGWERGNENLPSDDASWWQQQRSRLEALAQTFR
jgi:uncharacterized damage-inducible protein DinB